MIKPLNAPQLSAAKPRCGLQSIAELMPRLIRQYEAQAELQRPATQPKRQSAARKSAPRKVERPRLNPAAATLTITTSPAQQTTFGWE